MNGAYFLGVPGSGKSTLVRHLFGTGSFVRNEPIPHVLYTDSDDRIVGAQIGKDHPAFPGTDRLSMAIQPKAVAWVETAPVPIIIGEGDRLATVGFLDAFRDACSSFSLFWLDVSEDEAERRRQARGSQQSATWLAGRRTKIDRLVNAYPDVIRLDADRGTEIMAKTAIEASPAVAKLVLRTSGTLPGGVGLRK